MPSVNPIALRPFSPIAACVIVAGCEISVSTPPSDSPIVHRRGLPELEVDGLRDDDARVLLEGALAGRLDIRQSAT